LLKSWLVFGVTVIRDFDLYRVLDFRIE